MPTLLESLKNVSLIFLFLELIKTCWFNEEDVICFQVFGCCCKLSNKSTKSEANNLMVLCCTVNFEQF